MGNKTSNLKARLTKSISKPKVEKARDVVAFDIGSNTIKIVEGKYAKEKLQIYRIFTVKTPEGAIDDGKIVEARDLVAAIKPVLEKNNIKIRDGVCTTSSSLVISREIVIPIVEEDEINTVIRYELEQYLPINLNDYVIQHEFMDKVVDGEGQKYKINVVAYPLVIAQGYYKLLQDLNFNPYVLDVNFNSLSKISSYAKLTSGGTVAFVDMGATSTNVTIFKGNKLDFTRVIKSGGDNIDVALSSSLDMSVKATESEKIEKACLENIDEQDTINVVIEETISEMLSELERILQFYNNQSVGTNIEKIIIYGGTSNIEGLDDYVQERIGIKTVKLTSLSGVGFAIKANDSIGKYINALGSIIRL